MIILEDENKVLKWVEKNSYTEYDCHCKLALLKTINIFDYLVSCWISVSRYVGAFDSIIKDCFIFVEKILYPS